MEHYSGVIAKKGITEPSSLIQIVLSGEFRAESWATPYAIQMSPFNKAKLITNISKNNAEVQLYSYDMFSESPALILVQPQSIKAYLFEHFQEKMRKSILTLDYIRSIARDKTRHFLFANNDYIELMRSVINQYDTLVRLSLASVPDHQVFVQKNHTKPLLKELVVKIADFGDLFLQKESIEKLSSAALLEKDIEILEILLKNYAPVLKSHFLDIRFVECIVESDRLDLLKLLQEQLPKSCSLNDRITQKEETLAHLAAKYNAISIMRYLLKRNVNVTLKNTEGKTPLNVASDLSYSLTLPLLKEVAGQSQAAEASVVKSRTPRSNQRR